MTEYNPSQAINEIDERFEGREFLAVADVASYLEVTPRTVTNLINRGELPAFRVGRAYRIPREGFKVYLESASA